MSDTPVIWLVEWQYKTGGTEPSWPDQWEPDHNCEIWFSKESAENKMINRMEQPDAFPYLFRVMPWVRGNIK